MEVQVLFVMLLENALVYLILPVEPVINVTQAIINIPNVQVFFLIRIYLKQKTIINMKKI